MRVLRCFPNIFKWCLPCNRQSRGFTFGKKKVKSEEELKYMMLPVANDGLGTAEKGF